jgi:outer membrane lipoprotein SlyB
MASAGLLFARAPADNARVRKGPTYVGGFAGSLVGSLIPSAWGASQFSVASMVCFILGGIAGVWLAYRLFY